MIKDKKPIEKPIEKTTLAKMTGRNDEDQTYTQVVSEDKISDEISMMAIGELLDKKSLKRVSRLKMEQIRSLTKLHLYAKTFQIPFVGEIAELVEELQISINGLGRKELVQLVQKRDGLIDQMLMNGQLKQSKDIFR